MADTKDFFEKFLPEKLTNNPNLWSTVKASIQFNIADAGSWILDLREAPGSVREGVGENPGCTLTIAKAEWEKVLDNPSYAMQAFMMGKIKVTGQVALAMQLQKILA